MKKLYGLTGLTGFILMIGAAGGAENTSFGTTAILLLAGLAMLAASLLLVKLHDYRAKCRRLAAKRAARAVQHRAETVRTPIAARKINSLELC